MDGGFWRKWGLACGLATVAATLGAGCDGGCQLHSDCNADEQCVQGSCRPACTDDFDCVLGEACVSGACVSAPDAVRPRPCNPETSEVGCPDATGPAADATPPDAQAPDVALPDAAGPDARGDLGTDAAGDGGPTPDTDGGDTDALGPDSGVAPSDVDLTGTYAVTRTVDLTNDDDFTEGDVEHFITNLTRLADHGRYRLDLIDPEGRALSSEVAVDFRSPEGPFNYQFRYERPIDPPPPGCQASEETFERGEVHVDAEPVTLDGQQILHGQYEGVDCAEADRLTNFTVRWVRIPVPVPGADGGVGPGADGGAPGDAGVQADAAPLRDFGAPVDAGPPLPDVPMPGADAR